MHLLLRVAGPLLLGLACTDGGGAVAGTPFDDTEADDSTEADGDTGPDDTDADTDTDTGATWVPVSLNFDDVPCGTDVSRTYEAYVRLRTEEGYGVHTFCFAGYEESEPNYIASSLEGAWDGTHHVYMEFATPVRRLGLRSIRAYPNAHIFTAVVTIVGGNTGSVRVRGTGGGAGAETVDLSAYSNVTRLELVIAGDAGSLGFDDLTFEQWRLAP